MNFEGYPNTGEEFFARVSERENAPKKPSAAERLKILEAVAAEIISAVPAEERSAAAVMLMEARETREMLAQTAAEALNGAGGAEISGKMLPGENTGRLT